MITKERAVELVESVPAEERLTWEPPVPELAVCGGEGDGVGWIVFWDTVLYLRTRDARHRLAGHGPYLVDRYDGSVHDIAPLLWPDGGWEELYLRQVKGVRAPDPLAAAVRELAGSAGAVAAMRHVRAQAPRLDVRQARDYVTIVRDGAEPPPELADLTREQRWPPGSIETLRGPVR
ncbi:YrhB domain-containing protein [Kitasatospora sp. NPDC089797]|uniref:YrhB domain-containing protein n=1 Tax=Kitasatospora sp. NPDC089797 TaxID=3155298 RepID=UPI0034301E7B